MAEKYFSLEKELLTYEQAFQQKLQQRVPVFIRVNGKAFGSFTDGFNKPFDQIFSNSINETMKSLCKAVPGCIFGYAADDEIVLIMTDYKHWNSVSWLNYDVNMINSTVAAMASLEFQKAFATEVNKITNHEDSQYNLEAYRKALQSHAIFTCKCFNVPENRVCDIALWLQCDHRRKAIQKLARLYIDRSQLIGMCNDEIASELYSQYKISVNDMPNAYLIGSACLRVADENGKKRWMIDTSAPLLRSTGRAYLQDILDTVRED